MAYQMQVVHWIGLAYVSREDHTSTIYFNFILKIMIFKVLLIIYVHLTDGALSHNQWLDPLLSILLYVDQLQSSCWMQTVP